ncbi:MAG: 2,3-bisphosphoglycerate-independent phosphoglycerate mutase [Clostridia bacterium]|nr:2,3-bisphosphoglycerate-independent phosphoglycerate mutase [Clostridia bacterium]
MNSKAILLILDGYGDAKKSEFNAVTNARTPFLHSLKNLSHSLIKTDGESVGLFAGAMGGSEVGHTTIGAGRVIPSTAKKINDDIVSKEFFKNKKYLKIKDYLIKNKGDLHLVGLMSDKNIHSNINHAIEIVKDFANEIKHIYIHFITDGRDSGMHDSVKYFEQFKKLTKGIKNCEMASVMGRFFAMDREGNIDRTKQAINVMFGSKKEQIDNPEGYLTENVKLGISDEFIEPKRIKTECNYKLTKNDVIFFFNFREDRLRQICAEADKVSAKIVTMSDVSTVDSIVLYPNKEAKNTLSEYLSKKGKRQIKIAETTKYAHVTYFLNGGREEPFEREDRVLIESLKVKDFAKTPKMKAKEITKQTIKAIQNDYDAIIVNFSNPDMIGHTGNYKAVKKALEYLDKCVKNIVLTGKEKGYNLLITADHGNAEEMMNKDGSISTAHSLNRVMAVSISDNKVEMKKFGELKDIAPTFLDLMGLKNSPYFEGVSLIKR